MELKSYYVTPPNTECESALNVPAYIMPTYRPILTVHRLSVAV